MLNSIWQSWRARRDFRQKVDQLNSRLELPPEQRQTDRIYPVILPATVIDGWPGPIEQLGRTPFAVAWAEVRSPNVFTYIDKETESYWNDRKIDWCNAAFRNLKEGSTPGASHEKLDEEGRPYLKVMLQADAFGPSRLLIPDLFTGELGANYLVAIPEQTCAVAYRRHLTTDQTSIVDQMIGECFEHGTEPMSPLRFDSNVFWGLANSQE